MAAQPNYVSVAMGRRSSDIFGSTVAPTPRTSCTGNAPSAVGVRVESVNDPAETAEELLRRDAIPIEHLSDDGSSDGDPTSTTPPPSTSTDDVDCDN